MKIESAIELMKKSILFNNFNDSELMELLEDKNTRIKEYAKGDLIFCEQSQPQCLFMLLDGAVGVVRNTYAGKRLLVHHVENAGDIFGEIYLFLQKDRYNIYAEAMAKTELLELKNDIFLQNSKNEMSSIEEKLRENMLRVFATKAYKMSKKVRILGRGSIREKIAAYLLDRQTEGEQDIVIPGREDMADYLAVTRPSLSRELLKMQEEGIIDIDKRTIKIVNQELFEKYL